MRVSLVSAIEFKLIYMYQEKNASLLATDHT